VRVPDEIRDCVCFITARAGGVGKIGTAFFVGVGIGFEDRVAQYVVTSKHCLLVEGALADDVVLRLNAKTGDEKREA
jgi:hypothetical protein